MKKVLILILVIGTAFGIPSACTAQSIQYLGTKDNIIEVRNGLRVDSSMEFPLTDTIKHPIRAGRLVSWLGVPYWYNGTYWYKLNGDTSTVPGQVNADWTAVSGVAVILHKPAFATVAITGSYTDLINPPVIPAAQVASDWNAASGVTQIINRPRLIDSIWKIAGQDSIRIRVRNADNTFRSFAIKDSVGVGSGSGVSSVSIGNLSPIFGASVANQTTTPTISFTLNTAAPHRFLANTTNSTATPSYSAITVADLPGSIPLSLTLAAGSQGIQVIGNNIIGDTSGTLATKSDLTLKQNQLNGTGYIKQLGNVSSYLTPTQVTADLNLFTTTLKGLVPAPTTVTGKVLSDNGTWVVQSGSSGGITTASGDASGTAVGTNLPLVLTTVNSNIFNSNTLLKHTVNAKGLITSAVAANATDIFNIIGYTPFGPTDTLSKLATKYDLTKLDTINIVPAPSSGTAPVAIFGRNDSVFAKRLINAIQNNDSSITVGNVIASLNLSDISNKNVALNNLLPNQGGNATKVLQTDGTNTSWATVSGGGLGTNITVTQSAVADTIKSSTGTSGILPLVNYNLAGIMSPGDKKRLDSTLNLANTRVGDTLAYLVTTLDTVYFKGINHTSNGNSLIISKNHTLQSLSYNTDLNLAHSNSWSALQTFNNQTTTGTFTLSGTVYQGSNGKLDYLLQDTTTGITYRAPYIPIDTTGRANGYVLTWDNANNKAVFTSPGSGGTLTSFSSGPLAPLFTTSVATSTTTPALSFSLTNAGANTVFGSVAGGAPSYFNPSLTSSLFANEGTTSTVLHGNGAGNPTFSAVSLTTDVTGQLPVVNGGMPSGGTIGQAVVKNSGTNYDYSWTNTINTINGTTNQINASTVAGVTTLSTPQNIHTAATPTFGALTLGTGDLNFSRTDQANANITRPNTTGAKGINFSVVGGGNLDNFTVNSLANTFNGNVTTNGSLGVSSSSTFGGKMTLGASTTAASSLNIPIGVAPTSPVNGDSWNDGTHYYFRSGGVNVDLLASGSGISSLNGLTNSTQTFATGASGTDFNISSSGSAHTFNIPDASTTNRGLITTGVQSVAGNKTFTGLFTVFNGDIVAGTAQRTVSFAHFSSNANTSTISTSGGAGTGASASTSGTDHGGKITLTTGTSPSGATIILTVGYNFAFQNNSAVTITPGNANAAVLSGNTQVFVTSNASGLTITSGSVGLTAGTTYIWNYTVSGN